MKIAVCASMVFAKEILEISKQLTWLGHEVILPPDTENFVSNRSNEWIISSNISEEMKSHYFSIEKSDAVLLVNPEKNGIPWYVWWSTLMELAVAFYLNKKIFVLYNLPAKEQLRYVQEVLLTNPIILNGDPNKIQ